MDVALVVAGLVMVTLVVTAFATRIGAPPPSLLVLAGFGVGLLPGVPDLHVEPEIVVLLILPPLLFAAADQVSLPDLAALWAPLAALALGLVVITAASIAVVTHAVAPSIAVGAAFVLGAVLASTDPVAVTALSRRLHLPDRVAALVQGESLFNDATSLVLFQVAVTTVTTGNTDVVEGIGQFFLLGVGGIVVGVAFGAVTIRLLRFAHHRPAVQTGIVLLAPYAAAVTADAIHVSTVMAVIVAGLAVARRRHVRVEPAGRAMAARTYERLVALLENFVFALIGVALATFVHELPDSQRWTAVELIAAVSATLLLVRGLVLLAGFSLPRNSGVPWRVTAVVTWAGARGVIPLAAALSVPVTLDDGGAFPNRPLLLVVAIGTVVISLVVQGSTLAPLVRRLGLGGPHEPEPSARG